MKSFFSVVGAAQNTDKCPTGLLNLQVRQTYEKKSFDIYVAF